MLHNLGSTAKLVAELPLQKVDFKGAFLLSGNVAEFGRDLRIVGAQNSAAHQLDNV